MIQYRDWYIWTQGQVVARQFDHMTRSLEVTGELPEGWEWTAIVRVGDYMDYLPLTLTQTGAAITLTAQQLSLPGMYSIQLRGKQGELVRHTNVLSVYVPASLSGDAHWPELPSAFTELERQVAEHTRMARQAAQQAQESAAVAQEAVQGDYELVESFVTTEELASVSRTQWPDGASYNFKAMLIKMKIPAGNGTGLINVSYNNNWTTLVRSSINSIASTPRWGWSKAKWEHGLWVCQFSSGSSEFAQSVYQMAGFQETLSHLPITRINISAPTKDILIPAGTEIRIYGVRA